MTPAPSIYTNLFPTSQDLEVVEQDGVVGSQDFSEILTESPLTEILPMTTSLAVKITKETLKQIKKKKQKARKQKRQKFRFKKNQREKSG